MMQIGFDGIMAACDGAGLGGASRANLSFFQHDHVFCALINQVLRRATSDDSATDDDEICCFLLPHGLFEL